MPLDVQKDNSADTSNGLLWFDYAKQLEVILGASDLKGSEGDEDHFLGFLLLFLQNHLTVLRILAVQ